MKKLSKIRLVQYFLYDTLDINIGMSCGIFGANGSGKSSLLDAVQTVMTPASPSTRRPTKATTIAAASAPIASANTATPPKRAYATAPTPTSP